MEKWGVEPPPVPQATIRALEMGAGHTEKRGWGQMEKREYVKPLAGTPSNNSSARENALTVD